MSGCVGTSEDSPEILFEHKIVISPLLRVAQSFMKVSLVFDPMNRFCIDKYAAVVRVIAVDEMIDIAMWVDHFLYFAKINLLMAQWRCPDQPSFSTNSLILI